MDLDAEFLKLKKRVMALEDSHAELKRRFGLAPGQADPVMPPMPGLANEDAADEKQAPAPGGEGNV